ncbi:MAG: hypothetical protein AB7O67_02885 [Vicinamibacterales bacterium]
MFRTLALLLPIVLVAACSGSPEPAAPATDTTPTQAPNDSEHAGLTMPHGDHSPQHGGMVMMNDDLHFEVVFDRGGKHQIWFTDAVRSELPATVASDVTLTLTRPGQPDEVLPLTVDDYGESWVANGRPVEGDDVMVKIAYNVSGTPFEVEVPFFIPATTPPQEP